MFLPQIGFIDILLSILYTAVILSIASFYKPNKKIAYNSYFMPFVFFKIMAGVAFTLIHIYIYEGGDTFVYFEGGKYFAKQIIDSPIQGVQLYFSSNLELKEFPYDSFYNIFYFFKSSDVFFMSKITSFFCLLSFNQYLAASILFSAFSGIGIWLLYVSFCKLYPNLYKYFAYGTLFYPTIAIWGSGILKDPLTLSAIGFMFYSFQLLFQNKKLIRVTIYLIIGTFICLKLKPYILYTFIPTMLLWGQTKLSERVKNQFFKYFITPIIIALFAVGGFFFLRTISESAGKYSLDNVQQVAEGFHSWHTHLAEERNQSGYTLGKVEFTSSGILQKIPEALFVTYYRPFIFGDIRNFATAFEGVQSFILLLLTIYIILRVGFLTFLKLLATNNDIRAFMVFALALGAAVGLTSYNFGALSRYKIPCLPFFTAALSIIYYKGYLVTKGLKSNTNRIVDKKIVTA